MILHLPDDLTSSETRELVTAIKGIGLYIAPKRGKDGAHQVKRVPNWARSYQRGTCDKCDCPADTRIAGINYCAAHTPLEAL